MENEIDIEFNYKLFNPNFYHLVQEMKNHFRRFITLFGGSSSSKSITVCQAILIIGCLIEAEDTIVFRKTGSTLSKTIFKDFKTIIKEWNLENTYFVIQKHKIICINGSVIDFSGIDDPEKIKGISNYKRVVLEELSEFELYDFKQVRKRLRGKHGQQIISMFNPVDREHWIKKEVFDNEVQTPMPKFVKDTTSVTGVVLSKEFSTIESKWENSSTEINGVLYPPNMVVMKSTYKNNFWIVGSPCKTFGYYDFQTIADFEHDRKTDYNFYSVYGLGNWGKINRGGEFYKEFKAQNQTCTTKYKSSLPLHISFDENVNPYLSLSIYQAQGLKAWKIDEICLEHPRNTLKYTLKEFKKKYPVNSNKVFIYGDRTSLKADTKLEKGQNFFTIIEDSLSEYKHFRKLPKRNPNVATRGNFINDIFSSNIYGIEYLINENCQKTINDFENVKEASDGTKLKVKTKHPVTKVTYEKYGHLTDTDDYFLCEYFKEQYKMYLAPKKKRTRIIV